MEEQYVITKQEKEFYEGLEERNEELSKETKIKFRWYEKFFYWFWATIIWFVFGTIFGIMLSNS